MDIRVTMTEAEMNDFLQYRKEKAHRTAAKNRLRELAKKVLWAVGHDDATGFVIADQDHAEELLEMAAEYAK